MSSSKNGSEPVKPRLGPIDAISIIIGIIIGATIFETPPEIFQKLPNAWTALGMWVLGGVLALIGALCYAELATTYPRLGGDYNYLTRAYGPLVGYLFGWAQLAVVQTASIGLMAYIFANYTHKFAQATELWELSSVKLEFSDFLLEMSPQVLYAVGAVVGVTLLNMFGVVLGKVTQNLLSLLKMLGLLGLVGAGLLLIFVSEPQRQKEVVRGEVVSGSETQVVIRDETTQKGRTFAVSPKTPVKIENKPERQVKDSQTGKMLSQPYTPLQLEKGQQVQVFLKPAAKPEEPALLIRTPVSLDFAMLASAMVLIMLAYGGWNDAAFVAAEVRDRKRNIPLALLWGTVLVTIIYVLVNAAYIIALGFDEAAEAEDVAATVLSTLPGGLGEYAVPVICVLVMISALGAVNGLIFTSSRIYATLGADYSLFRPLSQWIRGLGTPIWALLLQMIVTLAMVITFGTPQGREALNQAFESIGVGRAEFYAPGGFLPLLKASAPVFWLFFLLAGLSLFVLRINDPHIERPFRVPLYPLIPLLFCASCGAMLYNTIANFAGPLWLVGAGLVLLGLPFYVFSRRSNTAAGLNEPDNPPG